MTGSSSSSTVTVKFWPAAGCCDFDDLVLKTEQLLRTEPAIAAEIAGRWDYLLVDECQDLNPQQYAIIRRLVATHGNCFAVGDDEQSIYAWAGADPKILEGFANDFGLRSRVILDENRRSSRQIFETARRLVEHNPRLFDKVLRATRESPWPVTVHRFHDDAAEAAWLIEDLARDRAAHGYPWGEAAILYRRHESGDQLEARLVEAGIPCQLAQGRAIADDPVVQYLIAALRVIANPSDPILAEQFARVVLPRPLYATLRSEADQEGIEFIDYLKHAGRHIASRDEDGRKIRRCLYAIANLPGLTDRHRRLRALVSELLSQRVGEYRTILEEHADELQDPFLAAGAPALRDQLITVRHGRGTVWLSRAGGVELGMATMLRQAGFTMIGYRDAGALPRPEDVLLDAELSPLVLFKALQLIRGRDLPAGLGDYTAVDIETNELGIDTAELVELAAVRVRDGEIVAEFHRLVKPRRPVSPGSAAVHGYTDADLVDAPDFATVWTAFRAFAGNDILVAHNGHGFDFPILRRLAEGHPAGSQFATYDSLLLARALHPGSRKLSDLAIHYGVPAGRAHHALDDTRTLARVFKGLEADKLVRARKTSGVNLLDHLAIALALAPPASLTDEGRMLLELGKLFALGRYSQALAMYEAERAQPGGDGAPDVEALIALLGGRELMGRLRREKKAADRYPEAMARLNRLLDLSSAGDLSEQLTAFLERVALSQSRGGPEIDHDRVNLLTLHSTKGLEFSRVYIIGAEDGQLPGSLPGKQPSSHELEEGRRLLYVGMTRAKDRLVLTRVRERGGVDAGGERFLREMGLGEAGKG